MEVKTKRTCLLLFGYGTEKQHEALLLWQSKKKEERGVVVCIGGRTLNRKPLIEHRSNPSSATLKRVDNTMNTSSLDQVFNSKFTSLLKFDMFAVLRELLRQNQCLLALKVFEIIRREHWYKPQVTLYADVIEALATNSLFEQVEFIYRCLKSESRDLEPELRGLNSLFKKFLAYKLIELAMDCYDFMKAIDCEPDKSSFRTLINGLEYNGKGSLSAIIRLDAQNIYGHLEFLDEEEDEIVPRRY